MRKRGVILGIFKGRHEDLAHAARASPLWMIVACFYTIMASRVAQRLYLCIQMRGKKAPQKPKNQKLIIMRTLLTMAFAAVCMPLAAQSTGHQVVLTTVSGQQVVYPTSENPVFNFLSGKCVVKGDTYEFDDIAKIQADVTTDGIGAPTLSPVTFEATHITLTGHVRAAVYAADGKQQPVDTTTADGHTTIDTSSLKAGVYILKAGDETLKFTKR